MIGIIHIAYWISNQIAVHTCSQVKSMVTLKHTAQIGTSTSILDFTSGEKKVELQHEGIFGSSWKFERSKTIGTNKKVINFVTKYGKNMCCWTKGSTTGVIGDEKLIDAEELEIIFIFLQ